MKKVLFFSVILFIAETVFSQDLYKRIDSLNYSLKSAGEDTGRVTTLNLLSGDYWLAGDFNKALSCGKESLALAEKINFKKGVAIACNKMGNVYYQEDNYAEALKNYLITLKVADEIGNKQLTANSYNNIGNIYKQQGNYTEALKNYFASLNIYQLIKDTLSIAYAYNNIGTIYSAKDDYQGALKNYFTSLKIQQAISNKQGIAFDYINLAEVDIKMKKLNEAEEYLTKSLSLSTEIGDKESVASCYTDLGQIFIYLNKQAEARDYLNKGIQFAREVGGKDLVKENYGYLSLLDSITGNYKESLHYLKLYGVVKDSMFNEESSKQISQLKIQYETDKREKELATLKIQNELQIQKTRQRNTYILLITSLSLLILSILWFQLYKRKKKLVISAKEIEKKNLELKNKDLSIEKKKAEERAKVQKEIAEQYHDILGSKITSLVFMCENERAERSYLYPGNQNEFVTRVSLKLKEIAEANRSGIIALDPDTEMLDSFIAKLRSDLFDLVETAGKELIFIIPVNVPKIKVEPVVKFNLSALMKEAINNAMKYSRTNQVTVQMEIIKTGYIICIIDHGAGIDPEKKKNYSYGIMNMKHRMDNVGGTFEIISKMNEGTTVKLEGDFAFCKMVNEVN